MSRQPDRASALEDRCRTVCDVLDLPVATGSEFVRTVLDRLLPAGPGPAADRGWTTLAYVLSQAFHARLPTVEQAGTFRAAFEAGSVRGLHAALTESPAFRTSPQATAPLVRLESPGLAIDVSETSRVAFTSGIQRVVRSVARHVGEIEPAARLVRWSDRSGCLTPLSNREIESLISIEPVTAPAPLASGRLAKLHRAATWPGRRIARTLQRRQLLAPRQQGVQPSLFLWEDSLLVPEVAVGEARIEAVRLLATATPVRATIVFYDAIPIRHPEFFQTVTHSNYLRSLSLARDVQAISCISEAVRDDLEHLLAVLPTRQPPLLSVHALGADLPAEGPTEPAGFDRPVVLCVGTIEPRKNQLRVLQAMVAAQQAGARFTGVFAGASGWLNGSFRTAFSAATAAGGRLVLRESIGNAQLRGLYDSAAFTIYCSLDEGFGLPIIESLRHGRPCITSDRGSMREIATQTGGCLLVDPDNVAAMAAAITSLVEEPSILARLTREAERAEWPTWRDYTATLLRFASRPAARHGAARRRAA
jgi:glycosyltransferase involved in cell wall biosynthesis